MKAIIIDDEPLARSVVEEYLKDFPQVDVIATCGNGFEGVKAIQQHQPDLVFLDIQMPKLNGFEMLELIEQPPAVIFTTAFDEYAIKAFETHAIDYLLKPFSKERFHTAMEKWLTAGSRKIQKTVADELSTAASLQQERIVVKSGNNIRIIPFHQIHFLEAADDYVKIHTADAYYLKNNTMSYYEKVLTEELFVRVHRSYIVNLQEITRIDPYQKDSHMIVLKSGQKIPVSKSGYSKLKALLRF